MFRETVRTTAVAMPLTNPAFPTSPYRFINRGYFIIRYRTDLAALRRVIGLIKVFGLKTAGGGVMCNADCPGCPWSRNSPTTSQMHITLKDAAKALLVEKQPSLDFVSSSSVAPLPPCARKRPARSPVRQSPSMAAGTAQ